MKKKYKWCDGVLSVLRAAVVWTVILAAAMPSWGINSKITRHDSGEDFSKGEVKNAVVGSRGTIQLGRAAEIIAAQFEDVWAVNCITVSGGTVYIGTSPNGGIYKYSLGKLTPVYMAEKEEFLQEGGQQGQTGSGRYLANEHIFAMANDVAGRLLAGLSGEKCRLMRLEGEQFQTVLELEKGNYIFAIAVAKDGTIYLGTGPRGRVYQLDSLGKDAKIIFESRDKNILSLAAGADGIVYAGSDERGIIYKIDPRSAAASVLYDSDQKEITALLAAEDGGLYAAATSAEVVAEQTRFAARRPAAGRPEGQQQRREGEASVPLEGGLRLQVANTADKTEKRPEPARRPPRQEAQPEQMSYVYKLTKEGFVREVFSQPVILFCLVGQEDSIFVGTGNNRQLFALDPSSEEEAVVYEDDKAWQITAAAAGGNDLYIGTANSARLIQLAKTFAAEGAYTSGLVDAGQPANWGKLQIEADIPAGCEVLVSSRSGNVKDINDPSFSQWTQAQPVTGPVQLQCPAGRFCQYKLILKSDDGKKTPVVRTVSVASTVPNLPPKIEEIKITRLKEKGKEGRFKVEYKAQDENEDKLVYRIDVRKSGWKNWIKIDDSNENDSFEWDARTVDDGRYEMRITASDERDNSADTKLTGNRVSDVFVVDNTPPSITKSLVKTSGKKVTLELTVGDELSVIGKCAYTVDSSSEWKGMVPDDMVYDTMQEDFKIVTEMLDSGEHIISVRISDDVGNTVYKSFMVTVTSG